MTPGKGKWRLKGRGRRYGLAIPYTYEIGKVEHRVVFIDDLCGRFIHCQQALIAVPKGDYPALG